MSYEVGQTAWVAPGEYYDRGEPKEVTVTKVTTRTVHTSDGTIWGYRKGREKLRPYGVTDPWYMGRTLSANKPGYRR